MKVATKVNILWRFCWSKWSASELWITWTSQGPTVTMALSSPFKSAVYRRHYFCIHIYLSSRQAWLRFVASLGCEWMPFIYCRPPMSPDPVWGQQWKSVWPPEGPTSTCHSAIYFSEYFPICSLAELLSFYLTWEFVYIYSGSRGNNNQGVRYDTCKCV